MIGLDEISINQLMIIQAKNNKGCLENGHPLFIK